MTPPPQLRGGVPYTMNLVTLTDSHFKIDVDALFKHIHLRPDDDDAPQVRTMVQEAEAVGRPKAVYQLSFVEDMRERQVVIDDVTFSSRILRVNLESVHRVFPYIATCGMELQAWSDAFDDMLGRLWADMIKAMALTAATGALQQHLQNHYMPGPMGTMNPGSLS